MSGVLVFPTITATCVGTVSLAGAHGKVVLLNFWATWCGPCRMEVPDIVELQKKYPDRLEVIGLVVDDADEDAVRKFAHPMLRYDPGAKLGHQSRCFGS